jgi:hypothetical protein
MDKKQVVYLTTVGVLMPQEPLRRLFCYLKSGVTEHHAMQVKGGCWLGEEFSAQANTVRANSSAVEPFIYKMQIYGYYCKGSNTSRRRLGEWRKLLNLQRVLAPV